MMEDVSDHPTEAQRLRQSLEACRWQLDLAISMARAQRGSLASLADELMVIRQHVETALTGTRPPGQ